MKKVILLFFCSLMWGMSFAQEMQVTGVVTYEEDGLSLPGVAVSVKDAPTNGVLTDIDGKFSIKVAKGKTLVFTSVGCKKEEIVVESATMNLMMVPDSKMLNEVVAIGYGTMKRSDLTGAISSVKGDDLKKTPSAGIDQALQGRASGVTVNANSGQPGSPAEIRIRGIGTVNGAGPIFVVDGVITDNISFLSPSDIESTEILKDASSAAIYGSRGANGVILITTRKGGGKEGKIRVSLDGYAGVQNRWNDLDLMKSKEFAQTLVNMNNVQSEMNFLKNQGFSKWLSAYRLGNSPYYPVTKSAANPDGLDYSTIETNWQDEVFKKNAFIQNYHLSVDGGNDKSTYSISGSYFTQEGIIMASDYSRLTLRVNSAHKVKPWLKIGQNLSFVMSDSRNAMNNSSSPGASILSAAIAMAPWDPTHYPQGSKNKDGVDLSGQPSAASNFINVTNPFSMTENSYPSDKAERWFGDVFVEITPMKGLTYRGDVSLDLINTRYKLFKEAHQYSDYDKELKNFLVSDMSRRSSVTVENILTYSKEIDKHSFSIMGGQTIEETNFYKISGAGNIAGEPTESDWYLGKTDIDSRLLSDEVSRGRRLSFLGRAHYSYNSRYLATVSFRADGSSKFPENSWGYFPSTSLAWRVTEESWMKDVSNLDYLKLRLGWGMLGNDKINDNAFLFQVFNTGPTFIDYVLGQTQTLASGAAVLTYINQGGKWETTEQWNLGIDFGLYKNKFSGTVDLFLRDTRDMLLSVKGPAYAGNRYDPLSNVGTVRNQGVEVALTYNDKVTIGSKPLNYSLSGNVSFIKNELTKLNGGEKIWTNGDLMLSDEGLPLFTFWGYEYEGVYKAGDGVLENFNDGDPRFKDLDGDHKISGDKDRKDIGNPFPWLTYGFNVNVDWNNFDLQLFLQGVYGNEIYNEMRERTEGTGNNATLSKTMRNAWTPQNLNGSIPNPYSPYHTYRSSRYVEGGAYMRLKNVQVGYTIPASVSNKLGLDKCRLYLSANNLLTFTDYSGYDPEVGGGVDRGNYPQARTFLLGFSLNF